MIETISRYELSNGRMVLAAEASATTRYRIGRLYEQTGNAIAAHTSSTAQIMALLLDGILTQTLPWGLILTGAFLAIGIEVLGIPSLPVGVGVSLAIFASDAMLLGGLIRRRVDRRVTGQERARADADSGSGVLFSSGLIAGGVMMGVILAGVAARQLDEKFNLGNALGVIATSNVVAMIAVVVPLAVPLYLVAPRVRSAIG